MKKINLEHISRKYHFFIKFLILWNMLDILLCSLNYDVFWGSESVYLGTKYFGLESPNLFLKSINILNLEYFSNLGFVFIILQVLIGLALLMMKNRSKVLSILFYFLTSSLSVPIAYGLDGGNNLANILFLYFLIFDWSQLKVLSEETKQQTTFIAYVVSVTQICFVYLVAGFSKVEGDLWINGTALYYIMQIPQYSTVYITEYILKLDSLLVLGNYITIVFQLYFPFIFFKKTNRVWILTGLGLHAMIAMVLGLLQFGVFMSIIYILFLDEEWFEHLTLFKDKLYERIRKVSRKSVPNA